MFSRKWIILLSASLAFFACSLTRFLVPSILPTLTTVFGLDGQAAGFLAAVYWVGYAIFQIPGGLVADRYGPKRTLLAGTILTTLLGIVASLSVAYSQLLTMQLLLGCSSAFIWAPSMVLLFNWFEPKERATAAGFFNMAFSLGATGSFIASAYVAEIFGSWQSPFWIYAVALGLSALFVAIAISDKRESQITTAIPKRLLRATLARREIWFDAMARFGSGFAYLGVTAWTTSYLVNIFRTPLINAGAIAAWMTAVGVVGYPAGGLISDRVFRRRGLTILLGVAGIGILAIILSLSRGTSLLLAVTVFPLLGFCYGIYAAPSGTIVSEFKLDAKTWGFATSFVNFMAQAGGALSPTVFGFMLDTFGSYDAGWMFIGLVALFLSTGPLLLVREGY